MDKGLTLLYQQIKERKISHKDAVTKFKLLAALNGHKAALSMIPDPGYNVAPEVYEYDEPFLRHHTVNEERVLLGVTHGSLAINTFFKMFPEENSVHLHRLGFVKPIAIKRDQRIEVIVEPVQKGPAVDVRVMYRYAPSERWEPAATGTLQKARFEFKRVDVENIRALLEEFHQVDKIYTCNPAVRLGESFKTITHLYADKDRAVARIALRQASREENHAYILHPLIINSAFMAAAPLLGPIDNTDSSLPFGIKDVYCRKIDRLEQCWLLVRLVKQSAELIIFDADVMNDEMQVVAHFSECSLKRLRPVRQIPADGPQVDGVAPEGREKSAPPDLKTTADATGLPGKIQKYLTDKLGTIAPDRSKLPNPEINLMDMGLESSQLVAMSKEIERETNIELNPTLFFEYPNVKELTEFFFREHRDSFTRLLEAALPPGPDRSGISHEAIEVSSSDAPKPLLTRPFIESFRDDIAVIGMNGMFAEASNVDQFWNNIRDKKNLMREIPIDHWDYRPWYDENPQTKDKTYCKWGSFIDDVDKFDARFFNISPREADWMDPQLRLLLQSIHATGEDAGCINQLRGTNTGVFVGVCCHDYGDLIAEMNLQVDPHIGTGNSQTVIANRVSFLFDLKGPSMAVDTACSSSLFALHFACQSLRNKECDMAFVGGVNLLLSSWHYRYFSSIGALSPTGRCHTFDEAADGYVPGECVASILLKPLQRAIKDGDRIYAVIKGSAALHGGYTPSLTAPSVAGEENVILKAWENAGINPETLGYIEAHGTGTKLGDPIELNALKNAFKRCTGKEHFCAIGCVKANIGHTEGAAGIAGILKVILQMKHRQIPVLPHFKKLNPYIQLDKSALYINQELEEWKGSAGEPRRAGVSSFGFSGAYAHVVIEEYIPDDQGRPPIAITAKGPAIIVLSAKNEERLKEQVQRLLAATQDQRFTDASLADMAYTLQTGRAAMEERLSVVASSIQELRDKLSQYHRGDTDITNVYQGNAKTDKAKMELVIAGKSGAEFLNAAIKAKEFSKLAQLWIWGVEIDWRLLYEAQTPRLISLPTYPFARNRHWIAEGDRGGQGSDKRLHPLIDRMDPALSLQQGGVVFTKVLRSTDALVRDHRVGGQMLVPGVGHLEMAYAAASSVKEGVGVTLTGTVLLRPLVVEVMKEVRIAVIEEEGKLRYKIGSGSNGESILYSEGGISLSVSREGMEQRLSIDEIKGRCTQELGKGDMYRRYKESGIDYGPYFQGVSRVWSNDEEALGLLQLPQEYEGELQHYALHPTIMDGALQSIAGIVLSGGAGGGGPMLPFSIEEVEVLHPLKARGYAYVKKIQGDRFHVAITDETGMPLVKLHDVSVREIRNSLDDFFSVPVWRSVPRTETSGPVDEVEGTVLIIFPPQTSGLERALAEAHGDKAVEVAQGERDVQHTEQRFEISTEDPLAIDRCLQRFKDIRIVYFLGGIQTGEAGIPEVELVEKSQERGVLSLFRLIKALANHEYGKRPVELNVITNDVHQMFSGEAARPYGASLHGLAKSAAKEYPKWSIRCLDISFEGMDDNATREELQAIVQSIRDERGNGNTQGDEVVLRQGKRYVRVLEPILLPAVKQTPFRQHGVYLIAGGAGGIGLELGRHLAETVQAKLVLVGRSEFKKEQQEKIALIESRGGEALYLRADITDLESMRGAVREAKARFGRINGVIHSALVLQDGMLENMDEKTFRAALDPKVRGSVVMNAAVGGEDLDFMLFFSSAQSFSGAPGQGNYAAGCAFKDAYARYLNATKPYPVKVINWGYWGSVGVVSSEEYNRRMAAQGLWSIKPQEGLEAVRRLLGNRLVQTLAIKADRKLLEAMGVDQGSQTELYPEEMSSIIETALKRGEKPEVGGGGLPGLQQAMSELERYSRLLLVGAFQRMGVFLKEGEQYDRKELGARLKIVPRYVRLLDALLDIVERGGFVELKGRGVFTTRQLEGAQLQDEVKASDRNKNQAVFAYPELGAHFNLIEACLKEYPRILRGEIPATDIMFPHSSMKLVEGIYKRNRIADYFNSLVVWSLRAYIQARIPLLDKAERIKILEVGAGTGGTSAAIFDGIREYEERLQYVYTDISAAFIQYGTGQYGEGNPFVDFRVLNIEDDPRGQGFGAGEFDVVIGANVLHATRRMRNTLQNIKALLKTSGWLIINELTEKNDFTTLTFGLLDGWWLFEDEENRVKDSPLLDLVMWARTLREEGFERVRTFGQVSGSEKGGQHVLIAESDGMVRRERTRHVPKKEKPAHESKSKETKPKQEEPAFNRKPQKQSAANNEEYIENTIIECMASVLKIDKQEFDPDLPYADFGVDSILAVEIINRVNKALGITLRTTDLFNYSSIRTLSSHIAGEFNDALHVEQETGSEPSEAGNGSTALFKTGSSARTVEEETPTAPHVTQCLDRTVPAQHASGIAIIGISGRFPGAEDVDEYWENLEKGRNSVHEMTRWDLNTFYDPDPKALGRSYCKWGGLLEGIDQFDPLFFTISPKEAELMDPQQRLFLQEAWKAVEDAGYSDRELEGKRCGVFVGCGAGDYTNIIRESGIVPEAYAFMGNSQSILAARISYFLNLKGPSIALDTACSSSLVALHLACESIKNGTSELAIAGGVTILTTPGFHIMASRAGMLSADGQCKTFDSRANGFVPGEGVGAVVLKGLEQALRDGDHIYGVIVGSAINQDGKTNGITAPSAPSQTALEEEVYKKYGVNPEDISYVEAHGTGTKLGDPIEISALTDAFRAYTDKKQYCAIGSVKANIGHTLAASGTAGLIKVLLCLKHKKITPSVNFEHDNEHINFKDSPFFVNTELKDWESGNGVSRHATISSFGFSGTNAYVVIKEAPTQAPRRSVHKPYHLIVLSGKTGAALHQKWEDLAEWLEHEGEGHRVEDIAYTLHLGRSHFTVRSALVIRDRDELKRSLRALVEGREMKGCFINSVSEGRIKAEPAMKLLGEKLIEEVQVDGIEESRYREKLSALADLYTKCYDLDWHSLYQEGTCCRIALPTYPFAKERYWIPESKNSNTAKTGGHQTTKLHPLIDTNTSTLEEQTFMVRLTGDEFYLADHIIAGQRVLPAVAYIEMTRAAGEIAGKKRVRYLKNLVWARPIIVADRSRQVHISLYPNDGIVDYKVSSLGEDNQKIVHAQGFIEYEGDNGNRAETEVIDIEAIKRRCIDFIEGRDCYKGFHGAGLKLGPSFQSIQELHVNGVEALSRIALPKRLEGGFHEFVLHPALLDGALQTVSGMMGRASNIRSGTIYVPFSIGEVEIMAPLGKENYAHVTMKEGQSAVDSLVRKFDICLTDEKGRVSVRVHDFSIRAFDNTSRPLKNMSDEEVIGLLEKLRNGELRADEVEHRIGAAT